MNVHSVSNSASIQPPPRAPVVDKAAAILDAALEAFGERGFGGTPVPLVADRAGVAAGTIYRYFPGKRGLVNALYRRWKTRLADALLVGLPAGEPARVVFSEIWRRLVDFAVEFPSAFLFLETHHHAAYLDDEARRIGEELDLRITRMVRGWQVRGEVRSGDPETLVALVYGGFVGVVRQRSEHDLPLTGRLHGETIDAAWALLAAPEKGSS